MRLPPSQHPYVDGVDCEADLQRDIRLDDNRVLCLIVGNAEEVVSPDPSFVSHRKRPYVRHSENAVVPVGPTGAGHSEEPTPLGPATERQLETTSLLIPLHLIQVEEAVVREPRHLGEVLSGLSDEDELHVRPV